MGQEWWAWSQPSMQRAGVLRGESAGDPLSHRNLDRREDLSGELR